MRIALTTIQLTGQNQIITSLGDAVWEGICNDFPRGKHFIMQDVADTLDVLRHYAPRTRKDITRIILANVLAEYEGRENECPLVRVTRMLWKLK